MSKPNPVHPWRFGRTRALNLYPKMAQKGKIRNGARDSKKFSEAKQKCFAIVRPCESLKPVWKCKVEKAGILTKHNRLLPIPWKWWWWWCHCTAIQWPRNPSRCGAFYVYFQPMSPARTAWFNRYSLQRTSTFGANSKNSLQFFFKNG